MPSLQEFLCCPSCRGDIALVSKHYHCPDCRRDYPILLDDIPNLRLDMDDEHLAVEEERVAALLERYDRQSFDELLRWYMQVTTTPSLLDHQLAYEAAWQKRGLIERFKIRTLLEGSTVRGPESGLHLDIGCGKGALLFTLASEFDVSIGVDRSLPYLILARKLRQELELDNVHLICGSAEDLAVRSGRASLVTALDLIEHVQDQNRMLDEIVAALGEDGAIFLNCPNRLSLFAKEPHVSLWGVGLLPRRWMESYVRYRRNEGYRIRLLSRRGLMRMLDERNFDYNMAGILFDPERSDLGGKESLLARFPLSHRLLNGPLIQFVPAYHVMAWRRS